MSTNRDDPRIETPGDMEQESGVPGDTLELLRQMVAELREILRVMREYVGG